MDDQLGLGAIDEVLCAEAGVTVKGWEKVVFTRCIDDTCLRGLVGRGEGEGECSTLLWAWPAPPTDGNAVELSIFAGSC